ncbi:MAG: phosphoethanolamine--lipid A transferase [Cocleimonas sp.]|nr:phosphoethanolamine--lipid A transferase [Cocleimonas sp.]
MLLKKEYIHKNNDLFAHFLIILFLLFFAWDFFILFYHHFRIYSAHLILLVSAFIILANNRVFFTEVSQRLDLFSFQGASYLVIFNLVMMTVLVLFFLLLGQKYLLKPILILFLLITAVLSYFTQALGVIFEVDMVRNVVETIKDNNQQEALELLSPPLLWHVFLLGVLPSLGILWVDIQYKTFVKELLVRIVYAVGILLTVLALFMMNFKYMSFFSRENRDLRVYVVPVFPALSLYRYTRSEWAGKAIPFNVRGEDAVQYKPIKKRTVGIMVVGETARADHFSLNNYRQETNPLLKQQANLRNFSNVSSCGTSTAFSVPCMFSFLKRGDYSPVKAKKESNVLDVLTQAGIKTLWLDNNSSCKGVCERIESINYKKSPHPLKTAVYYANGEYYDAVVLDKLDQTIQHSDQDILLVFHSFGSHGPSYYKRYPKTFAQFKPYCKKSAPQECNSEEIKNAYDNTILYTDFILNQLIDYLKAHQDQYESFMLYASDHGESLGEKGIYLHGLPYILAPAAQTHVPMMVWFSENYIKNHQINMKQLKNKEKRAYSHDNLSHSLLGLYTVFSEVYQADEDMFSNREYRKQLQ